jgi:cysteine protease ATG4
MEENDYFIKEENKEGIMNIKKDEINTDNIVKKSINDFDEDEKDIILENKNIKKEEIKKDDKEDNKNEIKEEEKKEIPDKEEIKDDKKVEIKKEIKEEKKEYNINPKELNKLNEVFINSFLMEQMNNKITNNNLDTAAGDFTLLEKDNQNQELGELNRSNTKKKNRNKFKEIYKIKELSLKKKLKNFHLFYKECKTGGDEELYKLGKVLVYTYRKNFPKIQSYKTKKNYTTDAWWGCMVRCGQMILSRGIYRLLKSKGMDTKSAISYTVPLFGNYPITKDKLHYYFHGMLDKYQNLMENKEDKKEIYEFYPPFSIKTLCDVGELFERTAGEWFSDVIITGVFKKISEYFELFKNPKLNVKIMNYQSCIEIQDILDTCFIKKKYDKKNQKFIRFHDQYYYYDKMGIVFVNVRVGLDKIPKDYYKGIKELFTLKECIGIIGGKTRLAYYFIGYNDDDDSLLYLDPHVTKEADKEINIVNILDKHVNKEVHLLKMSKMSTAFTVGFCFRTYEEFLHMYEFWLKAKQSELPILGMVKQNIVVNEKDIFDEDFSPTYEDKDEDDF